MEYFFTCPFCWQEISIIIEPSEKIQSYIEDCEVCCNPINIKFEVQDGEIMLFEATKAE